VAVSGSATGECGLLPKHFYYVAVVTLLSLQCHLLAGFVLDLILILIFFFVFNPRDLYYRGYKKDKKNKNKEK